MAIEVPFLKMHGLGNDFIITHQMPPLRAGSAGRHARHLCDRRKGVGADGLILIKPIVRGRADFKMRIFNADGSEAEMCGNGIRCCAKYVLSKKLSKKQSLIFKTAAGNISTQIRKDGQVRVNMGPPVLDAAKIPTTKSACRVIMYELDVGCNSFKVNAISMGNPHAVIYTDDLTDDLVEFWGKKIENHPFFPNRTNVEFVKILSNNEIQIRVWERGCGETMACGTGACASVVSGIINSLHEKAVTVHLRGGDLLVEWDGNESSPVFMTGPAETTFCGTVYLP